jgi:hypothetical protein
VYPTGLDGSGQGFKLQKPFATTLLLLVPYAVPQSEITAVFAADEMGFELLEVLGK